MKCFSAAVQLAPNNAEYKAWLAYIHNEKKDYDVAGRISVQALGLDPNCAGAYRSLGYSQLAQCNYTEAIKSYSRAIEIEPNEWGAYEGRAAVYYALGNFEDYIVDIAYCFHLDPNREPDKYKWSGEGTSFEAWYQIIHQHLMDAVWPKLRTSDEKYVNYWPCYMEWSKRSEVRSTGESVYTMKYFSYGSGYLCLTNKNIYLFSLAQVSRQFPEYKQGFITGFVMEMAHNRGELEKTDRSWSIPYKTVVGAQITNEVTIKLVTGAMTWEIHTLFTDWFSEIMAGINAGLSGKFVYKPSVSKAQTNTTAKEVTISLLKQLGELKAQGIISEVEFEQKKKELLARL